MGRAKVKAFLSPTLVLLAFDWDEGATHPKFLGFAVRRTMDGSPNWLPNRINFDGPHPDGGDYPTNEAPIQKFQWWDARIDDKDRGKTIRYEVFPVVGQPKDPDVLTSKGANLSVQLSQTVVNGIGSYFNRAVVSSQAFSKQFPGPLGGGTLKQALAWLSNGMEEAISDFVSAPEPIAGAIYHLSDKEWIIPALAQRQQGMTSLVHDQDPGDDANSYALANLPGVEFHPRSRSNIMHDKFLVRLSGGLPQAVLMGSANFTTGGLATQANVIHTFESPALARLYLERAQLLSTDPTKAKTAKYAGWSNRIALADAQIRVFFPPEPKGSRQSISAVVDAVKAAKSSVLFCLFSPTDAELRKAIFDAGDRGLMMFGLVNKINAPKAGGDEPSDASTEAKVAIYHRSRNKRDLFGHSLYAERRPGHFWWERATLPGGGKYPVYIHHKCVVIDGETDSPVIFTGSANMSKNAVENNDENLLEIQRSKRLGRTYLAEFMRLYEHYRARAVWNQYMLGERTYKLRPNRSWASKYYDPAKPEFKSRLAMIQ